MIVQEEGRKNSSLPKDQLKLCPIIFAPTTTHSIIIIPLMQGRQLLMVTENSNLKFSMVNPGLNYKKT
jgi:hypothetical protein